jgi:protein TonB
MSDRYIEKSFLFLLVFSLLIHLGVFALVYYLPESAQPPPKEPVFIDLQQMPELKPQPPRQDEVKRFSDQRARVEREIAPRGVSPREVAPAVPRRPDRPSTPPTLPPERHESKLSPGSSISGLLRTRRQTTQQSSQPQLFPGANRMAKLEDAYRHKFEKDVTEGDTRFLNSDDIQFGSFLRRFETAVYGVWVYPEEAASKGIEGITPVKITFNRRGEVVHVQLLESSGSKILDDEVLRTLGKVGPVGAFPRGYDKDEFHLIAFFQYGGTRRSLR